MTHGPYIHTSAVPATINDTGVQPKFTVHLIWIDENDGESPAVWVGQNGLTFTSIMGNVTLTEGQYLYWLDDGSIHRIVGGQPVLQADEPASGEILRNLATTGQHANGLFQVIGAATLVRLATADRPLMRPPTSVPPVAIPYSPAV